MTLDTRTMELVEAALRFADADPDPATRAALRSLAEDEPARLSEHMEPPVGFGTAGLRAVVGAGPARMNRAVVRRFCWGLADYLTARVPDARSLPVVVGYDARPTSRAFAEEATGVLSAAGIQVRFFREAVPTPLVAYAQRKLGGIAALVVTASHNPAEYNGCKVYGPDAAQLSPDAEAEIERRIARAPRAVAVSTIENAFSEGIAEPVPDGIEEQYLSEIVAQRPCGPADRSLSIVYTPLHGVGWTSVRRVLSRAGFERVRVVAEQAEPDGDFPTLRSPNPEEPAALDLALRLATETSADVVLANDPDADRLAVAVPTASGRWVRLTGNQIGLLLGDFVLRSAPKAPRPLVVSTLVSSPALSAVAAAHGARFERTLTGFKWILKTALDLERHAGLRFVFGFEEALGYCAGSAVRDKDGIGAALLFAELCAECRARGQSIREHLDSLHARYGLWVSAQLTVAFSGAGAMKELLAAVDRAAKTPPPTLGGLEVRGVTDFRDSSIQSGFPPTALLRFELEGEAEVLVRPSGTEPKLKVYVNLAGFGGGEDERALSERAEGIGRALLGALGAPTPARFQDSES